MSEIPRSPAGNIQFIGQTGQPRIQTQPLRPSDFDIQGQIPDRTQQLFAQAQQSLDAAADASLSVMQSSAQRATAEAQARTQSGFAGAVSGITEAITAGLTIYQDTQAKKKTAEQQALLALLEREIRTKVVELDQAVTTEGQDNGEFTALQQFTNEITRYQNTLPAEQILAIQRVGFDALSRVSRNRAQNKRELYAQVRASAVRDKVTGLELELLTEGEQVAMGLANPQDYVNNITRRVNELAETGNYSPLEVAEIWNQLMEGASVHLTDAVKDTLQFDERMTRGRSLVQRLIAVSNDERLSPQQRAAEIAQLQIEASQFEVPLTLSTLLPTRQDLLDDVARERQFETQFQNDTITHLLSTDANYARHATNIALLHAIEAVNEPARIETFRSSDNPLKRQVALEYDAMLAAHEQFQEQDLRSAEIATEISQLDVLVENARSRLNPTASLGPVQIADPQLLQLLDVIGVERGRISEEEAAAIASNVARRRRTLEVERAQISSERARSFGAWSNRGIDIQNLRIANPETFELIQTEAQSYIDEAHQRETQRLMDLNQPQPQSFNNGAGFTAPASVPLYTSPDGLTFPVSVEQGQPTVTSEYGMRNLGDGDRHHSGIDLVFEGPVRSIQGGEVIDVFTGCDPNNSWGCGGGWGNFVSVRTASGHVEKFSHLPDVLVSVGQMIRPGDSVATGIANSGSSLGAHLHFSVFAPDAEEADVMAARARGHNTVNPREYFAFVNNGVQQPYGAGLPPQQSVPSNGTYSDIARNFTLAEMFRYTPAFGGAIETAPNNYEAPERVYNNANPRQHQSVSVHRSAYPATNNVEHNYGYGILRDDSNFRKALANSADRLGIPAQWLVDVIELETTTFNPATENSAGAVGLIQFFPGGGLADIAQWMGISEARAKQRLKNMSRAEQMHWVERWLSHYGPNNGHPFRTITDLYGLINQGPEYWNRTPEQALRIRDGKNTLRDLVEKLGNDVGRRYNVNNRQSNSRRTHSRHAYNGCAECSRQLQAFGRIVPHYGEVV